MATENKKQGRKILDLDSIALGWERLIFEDDKVHWDWYADLREKDSEEGDYTSKRIKVKLIEKGKITLVGGYVINRKGKREWTIFDPFYDWKDRGKRYAFTNKEDAEEFAKACFGKDYQIGKGYGIIKRAG